MIDLERLKEVVHYDQDTGTFTSLKTRGPAKQGKRLGTLRTDGYVQIWIDGKWYKAHRLAWFYVYEAWPSSSLDHINRDPTDNRISNLRLATPSQQNMNKPLRKDNAAGVTGVYRDQNRWVSEIYLGGRPIKVGRHKTLEEAAKARLEAAKEHYGEYAASDVESGALGLNLVS